MRNNCFVDGINSDEELATVMQYITLFKDQDGNVHAVIFVEGIHQIVDIPSTRLAKQVRLLLLEKRSSIYNRTTLDSIVSYIEALADSSNIPTLPYFSRIGQVDGCIYYDLGGDSGQMVQVDSKGVQVVDNSKYKVKFKPSLPQVTPDLATSPSQLLPLMRPYFRTKEPDDLILVAAYLVTAFLWSINHPLLVLHGSPGSSKSTTTEFLGTIIDPCRHQRLTMNPDRRAMVAALSHRYYLPFDNLDTSLKKWQSDLLCNACTGGAETFRRLYETNTLQEVNIKGVVCLNGLTVVASEPDLLDRAILIELERVPDDERLPEEELSRQFRGVLPKLLGTIFNTLHKLLSADIKGYPSARMLDFAKYGYGVAQIIGGYGELFSQRYLFNQELAKQESRPPLIVECLTAFMRHRQSWSGTMTDLRDNLWEVAKRKGYRSLEYPASASALSRQLAYNKTALSVQGITYTQQPNGNRKLEIINKNYTSQMFQ